MKRNAQIRVILSCLRAHGAPAYFCHANQGKDMSDQLEKNWKAFSEAEDGLKEDHLGRAVLLHDGKIIAIYNDQGDAYDIGCEKYGLGNFSVEIVGRKPMGIIYHSHDFA